MLLVIIIKQRAVVQAAAIRFKKIEPFILNSFIGAICIITSNIIGASFGAIYVAIGYAIVFTLVTVPWVNRIYLRHTL
jgi:hypothetical protein